MNSWPRAILEAIGSVPAGLADLVLPAVCGVCEGADVDEAGMCPECHVRVLSAIATPYCPRCGASVGLNVPPGQAGCRLCPMPLPRFARVVRLGPYADPLGGVVRQLKYRRREKMRRRLGRMLAQALLGQCPGEAFDLAMPVPMHWRRRLARGYDHARVLARAVARELGLVVGDELVRVRHTPPQAHLPRSRRIENVRGAFRVTLPGPLAGAHVLLVDDVTTTGATADEAARVLLAAGASRVTLAVIAKAEPPVPYADPSA